MRRDTSNLEAGGTKTLGIDALKRLAKTFGVLATALLG
jgi:hypothetical protein